MLNLAAASLVGKKSRKWITWIILNILSMKHANTFNKWSIFEDSPWN